MLTIKCILKNRKTKARFFIDTVYQCWRNTIKENNTLFKTELKQLVEEGFDFQLYFAICDTNYLTGKIIIKKE